MTNSHAATRNGVYSQKGIDLKGVFCRIGVKLREGKIKVAVAGENT